MKSVRFWASNRSEWLKTVIDRQMVRHVAALARLQVNEADLDRLTQQMSDIVGYVEKLN